MFGNLDDEEIEKMLRSQVMGRIGCFDNGLTYVVPVSYAYDGMYIYGHTSEGMKINIMRKNPFVCFEVDELKDMTNWKSVICQGIFTELIDKEDREKALRVLLAKPRPISSTLHLSSDWPFLPALLNDIDGVVYKIHIVSKSGKFEKAILPAYSAS